jgi:hypothetical protein
VRTGTDTRAESRRRHAVEGSTQADCGGTATPCEATMTGVTDGREDRPDAANGQAALTLRFFILVRIRSCFSDDRYSTNTLPRR